METKRLIDDEMVLIITPVALCIVMAMVAANILNAIGAPILIYAWGSAICGEIGMAIGLRRILTS
jgi:hypothetical protein